IYSRAEKLSQRLIRETINICLSEGLPLLEDIFPDSLRTKHQLLPLRDAIQAMHFPRETAPNKEELLAENLHPAIRRLIFEEFFKFQLVLLMD
ncbi:hypothetical protein, partial [Pseudomonas sp. GP01-A4]|uniref:hypothetical protein n=1 Tax=Pseudomonas sp. GP01-A4 TaxID=2070571 RepID=UPI000CC7C226